MFADLNFAKLSGCVGDRRLSDNRDDEDKMSALPAELPPRYSALFRSDFVVHHELSSVRDLQHPCIQNLST